MKKIICDKIVIGGGLNAVIYALVNDCTLVLNHLDKPSKIEYFSPSIVPPLFDNAEPKKMVGANDTMFAGANKLEVWNRLCFFMSLNGKVPFVDKIFSIRINEKEKEINVITENSKLIKLYCEKLVIFDDQRITGLSPPTQKVKDSDKRKVFDWISVRSGMSHGLDYILTEDDFVKEIYFYPSDRLDGHHPNKKDLVSVSYLTKKQLNTIEYSDLFARYKILDLMKKAGIRGKRNGKDPKYPGKYKHYAIKLETQKREVKMLHKNIYENTPFISFSCEPEEELLRPQNNLKSLYISKLDSYLRRPF